MRRIFATRRRKVLAGVSALGLIIATAAFAIWLIGGSGAGSARSGSLSAVFFNPNPGAAPEDLVPAAAPTGTYAMTVTNPNAGNLVLRSLTQNGNASSSSEADCPGTNVTLPALTGLSIPIPSGVTVVTIPNAVRMQPDAPTGCQSRTFTIDVTGTLSTP
jgi:hypothetical protein